MGPESRVGGPDWVVHLHGTGAPPAPPPSPGLHSSSLHLPADHPRQTRYPGKPGSAPTACHSLYVCISDMGEKKSALVVPYTYCANSLYGRTRFLIAHFNHTSSLYLQVIIQSQLGEFILQMDSEVHVLD